MSNETLGKITNTEFDLNIWKNLIFGLILNRGSTNFPVLKCGKPKLFSFMILDEKVVTPRPTHPLTDINISYIFCTVRIPKNRECEKLSAQLPSNPPQRSTGLRGKNQQFLFE